MSRLLPAFTVLFLLCLSASAQSPLWIDAFNVNGSGSAATTHFTMDKDGNSYHGGTFTGTAVFDTATLKANSTDGYVVKTSPNGSTRWAVKLGGSSQDEVVQVATDDSNNVYVTGRFLGNFNVQGSKYASTGFNYSSYLVKLDSAGQMVWVRLATGTSQQQATSVKVDGDFNVYWYGQYFGNSTIAGQSITQAGGSYDLFLAKLTAGGKPIHVEAYGGFGAELSYNLELSDKYLYLTGRFFGSFTIDTSTVTGAGGYDIFIVQMDTSLKVSWVRSAGGSSSDDITAIDVNSSDEILITGTFVNGFAVGSRSVTGGWADIYVAKISSAGAGIWVNKMAGTGFSPTNYMRGAHIDEDGACLVAGYHGTTLTIGSSNYSPSGGSDAIVVQYNKNGAFLWVNRGGGSNSDLVFGLEVDAVGYYYIGGWYSSKTKFGKLDLTGTATNTNYVAKGTPPVTAPNFKRLRTQYVYVDSTFDKSYDLNLNSVVTYEMRKGPAGASFDDGDATITYTPTMADIGTYWVVLFAENLGGKDLDSFQLQVIVPLKASLLLPEIGCVNQVLPFEQADPNVGPLTVIWDFGDGNSSVDTEDEYSYTSPGQYIVKMYVSNALNVTDSLSDTIQIKPLPIASYGVSRACIEDTLHLTNTSTLTTGSLDAFEWFENGISISTTEDLKRYRDTAGVYSYALVATTDAGCTDTLNKFVRVTPKPVAGFLTYNTCEKDDALFFDVSVAVNDTIIEYTWDFGDGLTETVNFPGFSHEYALAGTYTASLTTSTKNGCSNTFTEKISVNEKPEAKFNLSDLCLGQELNIDDLSTTAKGTIVQRRWSTGDGKSSSRSNLTHTYKIPGKYDVSLVSVNSLGCVDTLTEEITVTQRPQIGFTNTLPCVGQNAIFQDTSKTGANDVKLPTKWYIDGILESSGDFFIKGLSGNSPIAVQMVLTTLAGCYDSLEKSLTPNSPVIADFGLAPGCQGDTLQIINTFDTTELLKTQWVGNGIEVFKDGDDYFAYLRSSEKESKLFLRTYAKNGCEDSVSYDMVVYPAPLSAFTYVIDTPNKKVSFQALATGDNTFTWDFDNGSAPVITKSTTTDGIFNVNMSYNIGLQVISDKGCANQMDSVIYIGFPNAIADGPAVTLSLYPNPAHNFITLEIEDATADLHSVIRDVTGKEVLQSNQRSIDISVLSEGAYFISIEVNGALRTARFVKQ